MTSGLHLRPRHRRLIEELARKHLPGTEIWAYGSRVNGQSHDGSDLDLVLRGPGLAETPSLQLGEFEEALRDSTLPFLVEVHDWARLPERFHPQIEREYAVMVKAISGDKKQVNRLYHPAFPVHWNRMPLYSMAKWVNGLAFRNIEFSETGRPVIKIAEIKNGISGQTKFTHQIFDKSVRVRTGDLLFSWSGQPETSIDAFWWRGPEGWLNQHVFRVTPSVEINTTFFFYLLRYLKPNFVSIAKNKQTTGLGHVTKQDIKGIEAALPNLPEQLAIAQVLGAFDDKIELNRRMDETLEEAISALFKSWFVDFDPVRAQMRGSSVELPPEITCLFPSRLVDSDVGNIPDGWGVGSLGELVEFAYGKALRSDDRRGGDIPVYGSNGQIGWHDRKIVNGPGIVVGRKGNPGMVTWSQSDFFPIDTTFYVVPRGPKRKVGLRFLFYALRNQNLHSIAADSAVPGLNRNIAYMSPQLVPSAEVTEAFDSHADSILSRRDQLGVESRLLANLRDTLLPKLLSGEICIRDAEKIAETAT